MARPETELASESRRPPDDLSELSRRMEQLEQERDYFACHSRNLEIELRRLARLRSRIRELEGMLCQADARLRELETALRLAGNSYPAAIQRGLWWALERYPALHRAVRRLTLGE